MSTWPVISGVATGLQQERAKSEDRADKQAIVPPRAVHAGNKLECRCRARSGHTFLVHVVKGALSGTVSRQAVQDELQSKSVLMQL